MMFTVITAVSTQVLAFTLSWIKYVVVTDGFTRVVMVSMYVPKEVPYLNAPENVPVRRDLRSTSSDGHIVVSLPVMFGSVHVGPVKVNFVVFIGRIFSPSEASVSQ